MRRAAALLFALAAIGGCSAATREAEKPSLYFMSSLPILFAEDFALAPPDSPMRDALEARFTLRPIDVADRVSLKGGQLLLMAQPRAQPATALAELDEWVRGGGRLLLLADPLLEWPTEKPLGDPTAPMIAFADTGLLTHWGLTLYRPDSGGASGIFALVKGSDCALEDESALARCRIGKGSVTIIADADFVRDPAGAARVVGELERLAAGS